MKPRSGMEGDRRRGMWDKREIWDLEIGGAWRKGKEKGWLGGR